MSIRKDLLRMLPVYVLLLAGMIVVAFLADRSVTVLADNRPMSINRKTVIIDPGHGGVDGGATSCTGVLESQFNLDISLRLQDTLNFLGIRTVMIRTIDESIYTEGNTIAAKKVSDLKERVRIVNSIKDCILLSIHQNYYPNSKYYGAQIFYAPTVGSRELATDMQNQLVQTLNPESRRKSKKAEGIYLLQHVNCPAILIECGFLSNPNEEFLLRSEDYQKKLCLVIAATVSRAVSGY